MRNLRVIKESRNGIVLIVILFIVAMISVLSFGFAVKADRELSFGENVGLRMQMDYLSQTGLNYGKSLVMNPQNVSTGSGGYWRGESALQMESGSDYFDVMVRRGQGGGTKDCNYEITCEAYRDVEGGNIATSEISGVLRLDPCIGYVQLNEREMPVGMTVNGDMWCNRDLHVHGVVHGDVFANGAIAEFGTIDGQKETGVASSPAGLPSLSVSDYATVYYIGSQSYLVEVIDPNDGDNDLTRGPSGANPAGIFYCDGDLDLQGVTEITGMLVVKGSLIINDKAVTITAVKNFPALLVGTDIKVERNDADLDVTGFTQVGDSIDVNGMDGCKQRFDGALHVLNGGVKNTAGAANLDIRITADPMAAALKTWSNGGNTVTYWMPAGGSFFRSISRN